MDRNSRASAQIPSTRTSGLSGVEPQAPDRRTIFCNDRRANLPTPFPPGLRSEIVIDHGTAEEYFLHYTDPQTKFPIPNKRQMRKSRGESSIGAEGSRRIEFTSELPNQGSIQRNLT